MIKYLTKEGHKRSLIGNTLILRNTISILAALYLIIAVLFYPQPILHRSIAFGLFYSIIFLSYGTPGVKISNKIPIYDWFLAAMSLSVSVYIGCNFSRIYSRLVFVSDVTTLDIIFGIITIVLLLEGTRRVIGPWLPGLSIFSLIYLIYGHNIQGRFGHLAYDLDYIIDGLFLSTHGIWGSTMGIATGKIMVFLFFATLFKKTGAGDFLFDFVSKIAGKSKGGVGKVAVISSALFGMISGGSLTNVTTTGAMTIPAMIKSGFKKDYAASVESCASVGGIFMPPIMGSVAFIMSEVVGIPYGEIIKRAILPAIVYFSALFFSIDFHARKRNIQGGEKKINEKFLSLLLRGYNFFIPLIYLIVRLSNGRAPAKAGLETIVIMLVIGLFNRKKPVNISMIIDSLITAVNRGVLIVSTMATCGILVGTVTLTGIASKFTSYVADVADYSVVLTLVVVMLVTLFLGLAMNISSSYLIAAILGAPVLVGLGFEVLSVHMFLLFFAAMATITPPVAITAYAAATIAGAKPMRVGFLSMKVGLVAYILPFVFIYNPAILQYGSLIEILITFTVAIIGTGIIAMGIEGWFFKQEINWVTRSLLVITGILVVIGQGVFIAIGFIIIIAISAYYLLNSLYINRKKLEENINEEN